MKMCWGFPYLKIKDKIKQMTINSNIEIPGARLRRVGRPRTPWIFANCKWLYEKENPSVEYSHENAAHKDWIKATCEAGS